MSKSPDAFRSIGEVSSLVGVAPHVLRYWESQFTQLAPVKRGDGRRYYRPDDVRLVAGLCQVMREEGLSIRGARRLIAADRGAGLRQIGARRLGETLGDTLGADRPAMRLALPESGTTVETRPEATTAPPVTAPRPAPEQLPLSWAAPSAEAAPEPTPTPAASLPEPPPATVSDTSDSWLAQLVSAAAALRRHPGPLPASLVRALRASARESR